MLTRIMSTHTRTSSATHCDGSRNGGLLVLVGDALPCDGGAAAVGELHHDGGVDLLQVRGGGGGGVRQKYETQRPLCGDDSSNGESAVSGQPVSFGQCMETQARRQPHGIPAQSGTRGVAEQHRSGCPCDRVSLSTVLILAAGTPIYLLYGCAGSHLGCLHDRVGDGARRAVDGRDGVPVLLRVLHQIDEVLAVNHTGLELRRGLRGRE